MRLQNRSSRSFSFATFALLLAALLPACSEGPVGPGTSGEDIPIVPTDRLVPDGGDGGPDATIGNSLPGGWRPFLASSPWNTPIPSNAQKHPSSDTIVSYMASQSSRLHFARSYTIPVWVVASEQLDHVKVRSDRIFDFWDRDRDGWSDVGVPMTREMWPEQTSDGHLCIIDPVLGKAWEMSRFTWADGQPPRCTTFNIWDLSGRGYGDHNEGSRWQTRGGRGSGFPEIAGLLRPEEIEAGDIRHALVFTFSEVRCGSGGDAMFIQPPACRADGTVEGSQYPIEGMRFQLDPAAGDREFTSWGLSSEARMVARALQTYGMYLCDRGGDMKLQVQLLAKTESEHIRLWNERSGNLYSAIERIPTDRLRIVYTGEPIIKAH